ncbi:MgtC/SapB family protein [Fusobacterium varium]|uniref:MgtC/SapB family protein n=1 Tax=Fusobacterium varium TaxID=856 RepID=UPI003C6CF052
MLNMLKILIKRREIFLNEFALDLSLKSIILRIFMAIIIGGIIGYERGYNNRPAGFRTHILVCLGATIISLTQDQLRINIVKFAIETPIVTQVLKTDLGRMGAQVVSGIGFLGAGTIMREKKTIGGLTTAASIWTTGCIGLGIGWGFHNIAISAGIAVIIVLATLKKLEVTLIENKFLEKIEIIYKDEVNLGINLQETYEIFKNYDIKIKNLKKELGEKKVLFTLIIPKHCTLLDLTSELSTLKSISEIRDF